MRLTDFLRLAPILLLIAFIPRPAHAYLDPSTGGMLVSALISIVVTSGLAIQAYWYKLVGLFRREATTGPASHDEPGAGSDPTDPERERAL